MINKILTLLLFINTLQFLGCSQSHEPQEPSKVSISLRIEIQAPFFRQVADSAIVSISGNSMTTVKSALTISDTILEGVVTDIPTGRNRLFEIFVYDSAKVLAYFGKNSADVFPDTLNKILIKVSRVGGNVSVNGTVSDTILNTSNPVAYYKLDGNAKDETGRYNGTVYGSPVAVNDRNGKPNSAYNFGDGNYITLPNIGLTGDVSVFGWIKMGLGGGNIVAMLSQGSSSGLRWHIEAQQNDLVYYDRRGDDNAPYLKDASNGIDTWFYFGVVSSPSYPMGSKVKMYLGGKPYGAVSTRPIEEIPGIPLNIGRYFDSNWLPCVGAIDEIRIYKRALSDVEVESLYNSTK